MKENNFIFLTLIAIQLVIIFFLTRQIIQKSTNILGVKSVNPIKKENLIFSDYKNSNLKYFFEPPPNFIEKVPDYITWSKARYIINSDSLNERFDYSLNKDKNTFRIITLGDSFTFGMFVNTEDNWPEQLEYMLNKKLNCRNYKKIEVINLAEYGYDIQYSVERYKIRGQKYNPDLVLWFLKNDDFLEINEIMRVNQQKYLIEMKKNGEFEKLLKQGSGYPPIVKMKMDMENYIKKFGEEKILRLQVGYLNEFNKYFNGQLVFVTFRSTQKKFKNLIYNYTKTRAKTFLFGDLDDLTKDEMLVDGHPNEKGHLRIASQFFDFLTKEKIIPCN